MITPNEFDQYKVYDFGEGDREHCIVSSTGSVWTVHHDWVNKRYVVMQVYGPAISTKYLKDAYEEWLLDTVEEIAGREHLTQISWEVET